VNLNNQKKERRQKLKNITLPREDRKNLEEENWRCPSPDSPTGAHWWIKDKEKPLWICQWCSGVLHGADPWAKKGRRSAFGVITEIIDQNLSTQEVAEELDISSSMVYKLIKNDKLDAKTVDIGHQKRLMISREEIERAKAEIKKEDFPGRGRRKTSI